MAATIVAIRDTDALKAAGAHYPETLNAWRWMYRHRHERGVADAFLRQGRRILVDVPKYLELVRERKA